MSITFEVYHCLSFHKDALNNVFFFFTCLKNMGPAARKRNIVSCEQQRRWPVCTDWSAPLLLAFETWYRLLNFHILTSVQVLLCWKPWTHFTTIQKRNWSRSNLSQVIFNSSMGQFYFVFERLRHGDKYIRGTRKFCQRGSNSDNFFYRWERIQIPLKVGHHRPTSEMPFKRLFAGVPVLVQHWMLALRIGYTVGNVVLRRRASGAVKRDFRTYIRRYIFPNVNFEHGYHYSNAFL